MRFLKRIATGIKNIWAWAPIVWADRQWDYVFIYSVLAFKLRRMQQFFESDAPVVADADEIAQSLKKCADKAERLANDNYLTDELKAMRHEERWGESWFICNPIDEELSEWRGMWYEKAESYEENDQANREFLTASRRAEAKKKLDRISLFGHIIENIENWWD